MFPWLKPLRAWWRRPALSIDQLPADGPVDSDLVMRAMLRDLLLDRRRERRTSMAKAVLYFLMFAVPAALYIGFYAWQAGFRLGPSGQVVGVVELSGEMADGARAGADRVIPALRKAFESDHVQAVVLSIDSPGGAPLEAERIYSAIESWRRTHPKPVVAVINNVGASAAYMVALHCDAIYAGRYSLVGSVGAVLSGWDFHRALQRVDVGQRVYASGNLKAMLNPYLPMSPEADAKARDLVTKMGQQFKAELVSQRQNKLAAGVDFASGEIWGGAEAQQLGLVDEVSTLDQVIKARWPGLKIHSYGPSAANGFSLLGGDFGASVRELLIDVLTSAPGQSAMSMR